MMAILAPRAASSLFHSVSLFSSSTSSSSPLKHLDNKILLRSASALAGASPLLSLCQKKGSPVLSSSPTSHVVNNLSPAKSSFHTSVFDRLLGNPGSVKFDLVPSGMQHGVDDRAGILKMGARKAFYDYDPISILKYPYSFY